MKFPGKRKSQHYFPVSERNERGQATTNERAFPEQAKRSVLGICQTLVDIEAHVDEEFIARYNLVKGQSMILSDEVAQKLYSELKSTNQIVGEFAGGTVANTLHNYSILARGNALLLGTMCRQIQIGDYAFKYLRCTGPLVDLSQMQAVDGPVGHSYTLITKDGERTFGIAPGKMNDLSVDSIHPEMFTKACALVLSAYLLRHPHAPIYQATMKAVKLAKAANVPVIFNLGTDGLVKEYRSFLQEFIAEYVQVLTMNGEEAYALTGEKDPLSALDICLQWADLALMTVGEKGLYLGGYCDESALRESKNPLLPHATLPGHNRYEFSRAMRRIDCEKAVRIFSHIDPFLGGPGVITNTSGAGDGAMAALIHDIAANDYHREVMPDSPKHQKSFLTYSSLSQICKYANRVSYEVLKQNAPRLMRGLPEREDCLEEAYWEK